MTIIEVEGVGSISKINHVVSVKLKSEWAGMVSFYRAALRSSVVGIIFFVGAGQSFAFELGPTDPLRQLSGVSTTPANHMFDPSSAWDVCAGDAKTDLTLLDIVSSALCHNPKTRDAWANVKVQAAQVGVSEAAYLPTLNGTMQAAKDNSNSRGTAADPFDVQSSSRYQSAGLTLTWLLYDFGARSAGVHYAKSKLASALAGQDSALQTVFANTVKDYYAAFVAQKNMQATRDIEADAKRVLDAATVRVQHGVAAVSDQLQAQTSYFQATFNRHKAEGDWLSSLGLMAIDMGRRPNQPLHLVDADSVTLPTQSFVQSVDQLLQTAQERHPSLIAARADLAAAQANEEVVRAQGRPTISFVGKYNYDNQPQSSGAGQQYFGETVRDRSVGLQVNIPLFEGFTRTYQVRGAQAQVEGKEASLSDAELQVASSVWTDYQTLTVDTENVHTSQQILDSAHQAFDAAQARYAKGVTGILEVITTQTALANALQQQISALAGWQNARIQLASSLGSLDVRSLYPTL
ncbi:TolC family protein [Pseudomonas sp. 10S4]|uniref:TolC family protein n=2 Tax=Pseudomonas sp. 10S4 TaxID=3048583 RepID=UPI002B23CA25|nr:MULTISPECIES: TolC family protein [unclassified Pseudomonas]MEB0229078.1 TolC family protein [Pseudomonas sp. 5S1]MEB0298931.1 TolC family protein [Pseudomonas sp. 10S4]